MRVRHHSSSSSSDDEHRSKRDHDRVRYVRRRPGAERSHSYERRRPKNEHRESRSWRRKPDTLPDDSDDDTVYRVDRCGRRCRRSGHDRSRSRHRHNDREDRAYMSGALRPDREVSPGCNPSIPDARIMTESSPGHWSAITGPFKIDVDCPKGSRNEEHDRCTCRRCHRGRPGSRHDRYHRRSSRTSCSRSSSSRTATPKSGSPRPKGILRRESSGGRSRSRLRKSVSFDSGTKIPHDYDERTLRLLDDMRDRTPSPERAHERPDPHKADEPEPAVSPEEFQESYIRQAKGAAEMAPELPIEIESPDSDAYDKCPRFHGSDSSRCRQCHHCPPNPRPRKRGRKKPKAQTRDPKPARLSQEEERLRSVAHSVLLSTHQAWCTGHCSNLSNFVREKGGCPACCQRSRNVRRTGDGQSTPHCRTLIHCHKLGHGIFPMERSDLPMKAMVDRALRLAYADVYCCYLGEYLTPEEYLAYRRRGIADVDLGLWIRHGSVQERAGLSEEVEKTMMLWSEIMRCARQRDEPCGEETVLQVLEAMGRA